MKYKVKPKNKPDQKIKMLKKLDISFVKLSDTKLVRKTPAAVTNTSIPLGRLLLKDLPWLLMNFWSSLIYCTGIAIITTSDMVNKTTINGITDCNLMAYINNVQKVIPKLLPTQNIRFQKLSLFNLAWKKPSCGVFDLAAAILLIFLRLAQKLAKSVKSSSMVRIYSHYWLHQIYTIYTAIVAKICGKTKQIIASTLIIYLALCVNSANALASKSLQEIFKQAEAKYEIPEGLLVSIARVESAIRPIALNINGKSVNPRTNNEARELIQAAISAGVTNIDIGIMQLNYRWHGAEFGSIDEMLIAEKNIEYAAKFLRQLKAKHINWHSALRHYHSANPEHYYKYSRKVVMCWLGNDNKTN